MARPLRREGRQTPVVNGVGVILLASVLFGAMAVGVRVAARDMQPLQIAFVRFTGSLLVLLALNAGRSLRPRAGNLKRLLQRGLLGAGAIVLYYVGIQGAGAGLATLLQCTYPVPATLFAALLMDEPLSRRSVAAVVLNLAGVYAVLGPGSSIGPGATLGALSALGASVLAGGAVATARHLRASEDASLITIYFMAVGATVTAPAVWFGVPHWNGALVCAVAVVILTSAGGQWLLHHGLGFTSATQGSLACATSVVTAAVLEALLLGEHLSRHTLLSASLMVAAVGLAAGGVRGAERARDQRRLPVGRLEF